MRSPEDWVAVTYMVKRLDRIDATFVGWSDRMDARCYLMATEDPWVYIGAARQIAHREERAYRLRIRKSR